MIKLRTIDELAQLRTGANKCPIADWSSYKDDSFFQNLIADMQEYGYDLISKVAMSTDDAPYHVNFVSQARNTRMFFSHKEKAIIVMIGHYEYEYDDSSARIEYWHLDISANIDPAKEVNGLMWDKRPNERPGSHSSPNIGQFNRRGYSSISDSRRQRHWTMENANSIPLTTGDVAYSVALGLEELACYANDLPFQRLQVTPWVPQSFKDCNNTFWSRFDREALRKVVKDPWGGTK